MSYSTDPVLDAHRYYDKQGKADDLREKAEIVLATEFITACRQGDAGAVAPWAGDTVDLHNVKHPRAVGSSMPMRSQRLHEVLAESLDMGTGPTAQELYQLVLNAAFGDIASVQAQARHLLSNMASSYAYYNVGEVE